MTIEELKSAMEARDEIKSSYYSAWKDAERKSDEATKTAADLSGAAWLARIERKKNGTDEKSAAELASDRATKDAVRKQERERAARLAYYIAADNAKRATLEYLSAAAVEVLRPYIGKPYGEKTREKIAKEAAAVTGWSMYLNEEYARSTIRFYPDQWKPGPRENMEISYYHAAKDSPAPVLIENRIQATTPEQWKPDYCTAYHDDGSPAEIAAAVEAAHAEALEAYAAFEAAAAKYNALRPVNAKSISTAGNRPYGIF